MGFKKHNWIGYQNFGTVIELTIRDSSRKKIDNFICDNNKTFNRVLRLVKKYGFSAEKIKDEKSEEEEEKEFLDKEMSW